VVRGGTLTQLDVDGKQQAAAAASSAGVTVVVAGIDKSIEDEGRDRTDIRLPAAQRQLLDVVLGGEYAAVVLLVVAMLPLMGAVRGRGSVQGGGWALCRGSCVVCPL
jgi:beta-glucosidase